MSSIKAHICFVSDQPLPNILPVLHEDMKPEMVYLLCSEQQKERGNDLAQEAVLKNHGISVKIVPVTDAYNLSNIQAAVDRLINKHQPGELAFNATGGTKPMSIAAFEQCVCQDVAVFYLQTPTIIWLSTGDCTNNQPLEITESLSLRDFLKAHGVGLNSYQTNRIPESRSQLARSWASRAEKYAKEYSAVNYYAASAEGSNLKMEISKSNPPKNLPDLLRELERHQLIKSNGSTGRGNQETYVFQSEDDRRFVNGGWLEDHVFNELKSLCEEYPQITQVARNVEVLHRPGSTKSKVRNEFDVVAIINHRMWVFECKTSRPANPQSDRRDGEEMVYKLAGIMKNLGGLRTQGCVVSFNTLRPEEKSRAKLLDIDVIDGRNLKDLRSKLVTTLGLR